MEIKNECNNHSILKVILETSEIEGGFESIYLLSYASLVAGANFIKTSTGKGLHGATIEHFIVMALALRDFINNSKISNETY